MKAFCLFEQSGTFKNAFIKNGIEAEDYDIRNDFGETDKIIDLFAEIEKGYSREKSIFDNVQKDDVIMAFFPCTRFEAQIQMQFAGNAFQQRSWSEEKKLEHSMKLHKELHELYMLLSKLCIICIRGGLRLIVENPYTNPHYLRMYWSIKPAVVDLDRTKDGDYYKKPTQYFFIGLEPKNNLVFEALDYVPGKRIERAKGTENASRQVERSMIHPQYADRFIRKYIL